MESVESENSSSNLSTGSFTTLSNEQELDVFTSSSSLASSQPSTPKKTKLDSDVHGYVLKLTNVMTSPSKTKYFKATLHDGRDQRSILSYNPTLHELMNKAKQLDKPVQLHNYQEKVDQFNNSTILTLGVRSTIAYSTAEIPFERVQGLAEMFNSFTTLNDVVNNLCIDELVNIIAYVDITDAEVMELQTKYGPRKKRDVILYDDSFDGFVKLTLWSNHITAVLESGVHKFQDLRIKSYNGKYLTTISGTMIQKTNEKISKREMEKSDSVATISLPAEAINHFEEVNLCRKCHRKALPMGPMLTCDFCGSKSLFVKDDISFNIKLSFLKNDERLTITLPHRIFQKFAKIMEIDLHRIEDLQLKLLTCKNMEIKYSIKTYTASDIVTV